MAQDPYDPGQRAVGGGLIGAGAGAAIGGAAGGGRARPSGRHPVARLVRSLARQRPSHHLRDTNGLGASTAGPDVRQRKVLDLKRALSVRVREEGCCRFDQVAVNQFFDLRWGGLRSSRSARRTYPTILSA
jgi:hypothetical protein